MREKLDSVLTCPLCGHAKHETMPTDACQFFYECEGCKALLRPRAGDCCVFCSWLWIGEVPAGTSAAVVLPVTATGARGARLY